MISAKDPLALAADSPLQAGDHHDARLPAGPSQDIRAARLEKQAVLKAERERRINILRAALAQEKSTSLNNRFELARRQAALSPQKVAEAFGVKPVRVAAAKGKRTVVAEIQPSAERFAAGSVAGLRNTSLALAYADPLPTGSTGGLDALSAVAPLNGAEALSGDGLANEGPEQFAVPDFGLTPDDGPLPLRRPHFENSLKPEAQTDRTEPAEKLDPRAARSADRRAPERGGEVKVAFAAPDNPGRDKSGSGKAFRNLFGNGAKAGNGVAVYDISAARVYMPDGSVLEAHSGIGKMADNPKYVNVKMTGPTPPHTYNLKMRERRFHGVEAIRMLPVDGKNKHGRDGFLTHSYLLRGGRAESHGCVAFKDYNKFLNAFKQGKIRQLVVVPGGGRAAVQLASNAGSKASEPKTR